MLITKSSGYAIRAVLALNNEVPNRFVPLKDLAKNLDIPYHQFAKVAQKLVAANLLTSLTGPTGGVHLSKAPENISLMDIIFAVEGRGFTDRCLLGLDGCDADNPCSLHSYWAPVKDALVDLFHSKSLADLTNPGDNISTVKNKYRAPEKENNR